MKKVQVFLEQVLCLLIIIIVVSKVKKRKAKSGLSKGRLSN